MSVVPTIPTFRVEVDHQQCIRCNRCVMGCGFNALEMKDRVTPDHSKCVACHRCTAFCPTGAINIVRNPAAMRENGNWTPWHVNSIYRQADTGGMLLTGMGNDKPWPVIWDNLLLDACQVTNPSIDPLREPMELRTYLGRKPDTVELVSVGGNGHHGNNGHRGEVARDQVKLATKLEPNIALETPIMFSPMSFGSISYNAQKSMAMAACEMGILWNTGEGGLHRDFYEYADHAIVQCASGRFGVHAEYLQSAAGIEIKVGQGAKPGIGGHLPGEKVSLSISETRMIPMGTDAISPAPHHDIYSIEDLRQLIYALKEATDYSKPVGVKVAAVHNVAAIVTGIVYAGADIVYIDGFRGGTGAAPNIIRDHVGIPIELALAAVDDRLRQEGIRNRASIIAAGSIRGAADMAKAIALGADAVAIGTSSLIAMGCHVCMQCHTGNCSWGITSQRPELSRRLDPAVMSQRLCNLVRAWSLELKEILGALGINSVESLRGSRERLRAVGLGEPYLEILGVKPAGR